MKRFVIIASLVLVVFACSQKTIAISNPKTRSEKSAVKSNTGSDADILLQGKTIYINRCGRCHSLKPVQKYTAPEWEPILKTMISKSRLNKNDASLVTAFVMAHAKK